ncbi:WD40 repeat-like protein [Coemansia reversa NRRL 1564]|uniref:WD40 repeat-like protein n=1 Tax=Coemansia reversa (strain ATCC 12441 / NRRL 1564) TaxID=763665 RepID=A0A2G5BCL2_COERN|nr:WD40 repeat-like protein [Coemansia reversa NRRL 1564]|eukprot:PIA16722.1 WD40 repeat-like protein [Coemansia reversa NRRL 1564]
MRFSTASAAIASSGIVFGDSNTQTSSSVAGTSAGANKSYTHILYNRPTCVSIFQSSTISTDSGSGEAVSDINNATRPGISTSHASKSTLQSGVEVSRGHGFRQNILQLGKSSTTNSATQIAAHSRGTVTKSTSAFVSRIITNENLARWIISEHIQTTYLVFNAPRSMVFVGLQPDCNGETLARLDLVSNTPLCHDINQTTRSESRVDMVMGFVQGNIVWHDPISGKYSRLNKNSGYTPAIMCVRWLPNADSLFIVGTADGSLMIMDRTKEDFCVPALATADKQINSMDAFEVACPLKPKCNPVAYWKVGTSPITSISFSPDAQRVAVTSEDGALRIIDYPSEILEDVYLSYFGGLSCCAWSDDGKYVVAGGKDDLITVWSYYDQSIVARCQGHESWVRDIVFDPLGHEDENTYRFMSVGDDAKLLVWDFSLAALHRPRGTIHRAVTGVSQTAAPGGLATSFNELHQSGRPDIGDLPSTVVHSRMPQESVAVLQPLISVAIHDAPICSLQFSHDLLVTACRRGIVKVWRRPPPFDLSTYL